MRKYYDSIILVCCLAAAACTAEHLQMPGDELLRIHCCLDDASKTALTPSENAIVLSWQETDAVKVSNGTVSSVFRILPGFSAHDADFEGPTLSGEGPWTIFCSAECPGLAELEHDSLVVQAQSGNGSLSHIKYRTILERVDDYSNFAFTREWATGNGATLYSPNILRLDISLPAGVHTVERIELSANRDIWPKTWHNGGKCGLICLDLNSIDLVAGERLQAFINLGLDGVNMPDGTFINISVTTPEGRYFKIIAPGAKKMNGGKLYIFDIQSGGWCSDMPFAGGNGSKETPWIITNYVHMNNMQSFLADDETVWFELGADIDMAPSKAGFWTPLNSVSPYSKGVHLDGKGHSIRNLTIKGSFQHCGMFSILNGTVCNLRMEKPRIYDSFTATNNDIGVICGFCGYTSNGKDFTGTISGVSVDDAVIHTSSNLKTGGVGFGGIAGSGTKCVVSDCSVNGFCIKDYDDNDVLPNIMGGIVGRAIGYTSIKHSSATNLDIDCSSFTGGIIAYVNTALEVTIDSCNTSGLIKAYSYSGGIVGGTSASTASLTISNSHSETMLQGNQGGFVGGILGSAAGSSGTFSVCGNVVQGSLEGLGAVGGICGRMSRNSGTFICKRNAVFCTSITGTRSKDCNNYRSCGAVIGEIDGTAYSLSDNYYSGAMTFIDGAEGVSDRQLAAGEHTGAYSASYPLSWTYSASYYHPYHGTRTYKSLQELTTEL